MKVVIIKAMNRATGFPWIHSVWEHGQLDRVQRYVKALNYSHADTAYGLANADAESCEPHPLSPRESVVIVAGSRFPLMTLDNR